MIQLLDLKEKKEIYKKWNTEELKTDTYLNLMFRDRDSSNLNLALKNVFGFDAKTNHSLGIFLLHNNIDIEKATKAFGRPFKNLDLGEYGEDLDASYVFLLKIHNKIVILFIDDRGTALEIESNVTNSEFLNIYKSLLTYLKEKFSDTYELYLKMINDTKGRSN